MTTMTIDPDDPNGPALPVIGDTVNMYDGTTARVLGRYGDDEAPSIRNTWQVSGPDGARLVRLDQIIGYTEDDDETTAESIVPVEIPGTDPDHVVARVLNAAINWENAATDWDASQRGTSMQTLFAATDALHAAIRAYMPMVAK